MENKAIFKAYADYCWLNNSEPASIRVFCEELNLDSIAFKTRFQDFSKVRKMLLEKVLNDSIAATEAASEEHEYSSREKTLALFFSLVEHFAPFKPYLNSTYSFKNAKQYIEDWRLFNQTFVAHTKDFLEDEKLVWLRDKLPGKVTKEVNALLLGWNYVFRVYLADDTEDNTRTDAAIEKTVHMYFDFAHTNHLEQLVDFGKFVFSTKVSL